MYLRDIVDDLGKRKLRDVTDFEWKRNTRFYGNIREKGSKLVGAYYKIIDVFTSRCFGQQTVVNWWSETIIIYTKCVG